MDEKVISDLTESAANVEKVKALLSSLYYHPDFSTVFTRPVINMLISACDYLSSNLTILAQKYRMK